MAASTTSGAVTPYIPSAPALLAIEIADEMMAVLWPYRLTYKTKVRRDWWDVIIVPGTAENSVNIRPWSRSGSDYLKYRGIRFDKDVDFQTAVNYAERFVIDGFHVGISL